jgi:uncharacterized protein YciI
MLHRALASFLILSLAPSCVFVVGKSKESESRHNLRIFKETRTKSADTELAPMRSYWMGIIKRGPNYAEERTESEAAAVQKAHLDRISAIAGEGKMILAGPFGPQEGVDDPLIGLFLYTVASREEAEALAASDPAVAAGRLRVEIVEWWGVSGITFPGNPLPNAAAIKSDA